MSLIYDNGIYKNTDDTIENALPITAKLPYSTIVLPTITVSGGV